MGKIKNFLEEIFHPAYGYFWIPFSRVSCGSYNRNQVKEIWQIYAEYQKEIKSAIKKNNFKEFKQNITPSLEKYPLIFKEQLLNLEQRIPLKFSISL